VVFEVRSNDGENGLKAIFQLLKIFLTAQKRIFLGRRSSPPLHGINLIQGDFSLYAPEDHRGYGSLKKYNP